MKKRCALYIRTSEIEHSRELQLTELLAHVKERGFLVKKTYEDSGVAPKGDRIQLDALMRAASMGKFDFVLVWRLDRMFHSQRHLVQLHAELQSMGIGLISVRDGIDTFSEQGNYAVHLFQVFNTFNRVIMVERAQNGINGSRAKGNFFGRSRKIDQAEVAKLLRDGVGVSDIAKRLSFTVSGIYGIRRKILLNAAVKNASGGSQ